MSIHQRTLLTVICEAALEKKLVADLEQLGAPGWTISDARGRGNRGVRSAGWDTEGNIRLEIICNRELAERMRAAGAADLLKRAEKMADGGAA